MDTERLTLGQQDLIGESPVNLSGTYRVHKKLGEGACSSVYLATHLPTGQFRCVKKIEKSDFSAEEQETLRREAELLKHLDHPNIIRIHEYYEEPERFFIVSEYCAGGELFDYVQDVDHLDEGQAARIMQQLLSAVAYLHKHNIVHRDIKPENLVFERQERSSSVKLIDFGTSICIQNKEKLSAVIGTLYYIAPEVLANCYGRESDIWSCGVIMYTLLCGYPPFNAPSDAETLLKIKSGYLVFPPEEWAFVSSAAKNLIKRMLTFDPQERPGAEELLTHSFFREFAPVPKNPQLAGRVLHNLRAFSSDYLLQKAVMMFFINCFDISHQKKRLLEAFRTLDADQDGCLAPEELVRAYTRYGDPATARAEAEKVLQALGVRGQQGVNFTEFLMATLDYRECFSRDALVRIFRVIDANGDGLISRGDLKKFLHMKGKGADHLARQLIKEVDSNGDGEVSLSEFEDMMKRFLKNN